MLLFLTENSFIPKNNLEIFRQSWDAGLKRTLINIYLTQYKGFDNFGFISAFMVLRISAVHSVVTTFPPYLFKIWNLNKNLSTLNLTWKSLMWNSNCSELTATKGSGAHRDHGGPTDCRRPGVSRGYQVSWRSWGPTAPRNFAAPGGPGIMKL